MASVGASAGHRRGPQRNGIGGVGGNGGNADEQQRRKSNKTSAASYSIDRSAERARNKDENGNLQAQVLDVSESGICRQDGIASA